MNRTPFPGTRNRIATDLRQVRGVRQTAGPSVHKDALYTLLGLAGITYSSHKTPPTRMRRGSRRTNGVKGREGAWQGERGEHRHGREKKRRDGYVGTSSTSHGASLLSPRISCQLLLFLYRVPPCAAFQHGKSLDAEATCLTTENRTRFPVRQLGTGVAGTRCPRNR